jgi:hypothetical protein
MSEISPLRHCQSLLRLDRVTTDGDREETKLHTRLFQKRLGKMRAAARIP